MKLSRLRLADYVKSLHQKACSTITSLHSINEIIDLWCCRLRCRRCLVADSFSDIKIFLKSCNHGKIAQIFTSTPILELSNCDITLFLRRLYNLIMFLNLFFIFLFKHIHLCLPQELK